MTKTRMLSQQTKTGLNSSLKTIVEPMHEISNINHSNKRRFQSNDSMFMLCPLASLFITKSIIFFIDLK